MSWPDAIVTLGVVFAAAFVCTRFVDGDNHMFALIQRGQIYTDRAGYPVVITRITEHSVFFRRMDGRSGRVRITEFNSLFEHIDHQEYRKILADTEQEKHLKKLRAIKRK